MKNEKGIKHWSFVKDNSKLRKLITENPDLPIVVLASNNANTGDYNWMYCSSISCSIDEILDCEVPFNSDYVFSDRLDFECELKDYLAGLPETEKYSDEEFEKFLNEKLNRYKPFWKKVIAIWADN